MAVGRLSLNTPLYSRVLTLLDQLEPLVSLGLHDCRACAC